MAAADHRAVPSRAPGRCLGGVPAGSEPAGRRAWSRPWSATAAARAINPDSGRVAGTPCQRGGPPESDLPMGNLPSLSADLVGRDTEVAALSDLLATERLVEIVGPGGIGKTAVAIAVGRRLIELNGSGTGGVWLARLETAATADDVVDTVIAALNVAGGEPALYERLKAHCRVGDPGQLRTRSRRCRGSREFASSTLPPLCGSCAPAKSHSMLPVRPFSSSHLLRFPTPSRSSPVEPLHNG